MNVEGEFRKLVSSNTWMQYQLFLHGLFLLSRDAKNF